MTDNTIIQPEGWGDDYLSEFQTIAYKNQLATFVHSPQWQKAIIDVSMVLHKCSLYAVDQLLKTDEPSALLLFLTANNHFLASTRLVSAGHCLPTYPTGRATVESALYGWYLLYNKEAALRWNNKPEDKKTLNKWNEEFRFSSLTRNLHKIDEGMAEWAKYLHQLAIDFGAHPNRDALYSNMEHVASDDGSHTVRMVTLHKMNPLSISTMKFTIETGLFSIRLFKLGFPDGSEALGLDQDIIRLTSTLRALQQTTKLE